MRNHRGTAFDADLANETPSQSFESGSVSGQQTDPTGAISGSVSQTVVPSFQDRVSWPKCHVGKVVFLLNKYEILFENVFRKD